MYKDRRRTIREERIFSEIAGFYDDSERALELLRTNHECIDYDLRVFLARQRTAYERRQKHGTSNEVDFLEIELESMVEEGTLTRGFSNGCRQIRLSHPSVKKAVE